MKYFKFHVQYSGIYEWWTTFIENYTINITNDDKLHVYIPPDTSN